MFLNAFNIEIQELRYDNREDKIKLLKKINNYRKDAKELRKELGKDDESYVALTKLIKKFKQKLSEMDKTFYQVILVHKNLKKEFKSDFIERDYLRDSINHLKRICIDELKRNREENKFLIKKSKTGNVNIGGQNVPYKYYLTGLVHATPNNILSIIRYRFIEKFYISKKPETDEKHIGVEIECYIKSDEQTLAQTLLNYDLEIYKKVNIKDDGSLRPKRGERGVELAILDTEDNIAETLKTVQKALDYVGVRIGTACGLHVHLDMRYRMAEKCFHNLVKMQNILYKMQPSHRNDNQYCRETSSSNIYKMIRTDERYWCVNASSIVNHETLEIRVHEGTYNWQEISNWINFLVKICSVDVKMKKAYRSIKSAAKDHGFGIDIENYVESRIKKYEVA